MKKYIDNKSIANGADSLSLYKHKNAQDYDRSFSRAVESLYSSSKRNLASYGRNLRDITNKGLQNSGYSDYLNQKAQNTYTTELGELKSERAKAEAQLLGGYQKYLEDYEHKSNRLKEKVSSYLIKNGIVNLDDSISYGLGQGLSKADAIAIGESAYSTNKQKVFSDLISQAASLGLDRDGAMMLAKKLGISDSDAEELGKEIDEMMKHYSSVSKDYLSYLEEKSSETTNSFN